MIPLSHFHPLSVHFPIALITVGFLFDLINLWYKKEPCLSKAAYYLQILGTLGAVVAWGTGYFIAGTTQMEGEALQVKEQHELFATMSLVAIIVATIARIILVYLKTENTLYKYIPFGLSALSVIFITVTGFLGGRLVIDFMIGI
ncbi:MAG: DUF2231 domain-containing protein [Bacteroidetes bacterium]|nr:MAG: DUF2231 domain-containing protein [Bacteroidota bacterium]